MAKSRNIPLHIRCMLWGRASGRCEFCNNPVSFHTMTKEDVNLGEAAHIIGFSEDGPRGEESLSKEVAKEISNLMLLCGVCHKTIDTNKANYPAGILQPIKEAHERRIEIVSGIDPEKQSHILLYGANVGDHSSALSYRKAAWAMIPDWYPAYKNAISLGLVNSSFRDRDSDFWRIESVHLQNMVKQQVRPRLANGGVEHFSIFGFAPQPLLILLGYLLSDIPAAEVYQLHREPQNWRWQEHPDNFKYIVKEPGTINGDPALVLSLSAKITDDRIKAALCDEVTIWRVTVPEPNNDFLKSRRQLQQFRKTMRELLDRIKARHGENAVIHVFPAVPVAIAVEFGRIIMPKADLPLCIYDQNRKLGGFVKALMIPEDNN
ncbi:MAG: hypothetical protein AMJ88_15725 [Anaerolineae bacterium SM23_ 63]|nr:MAG: hypothetical protein AMJ88_15725 [Anaerolineae bacterium SM23_ 63]